MKKILVVACAALFMSTVALAAQPKTYQVTGPVLELTDDMVTVQKGTEKWEIARDKDAKVTGELKVGAKVTVMYRMKADSIEVKADKAEKPAKKAAKK